ncbi:MAG: CCA tRNA nucleotidyltransferase [Dehalococcoidia bacterium]|nr:CCA tRNA nucleotidyltransferase [Dehalococcoidia bacterium]
MTSPSDIQANLSTALPQPGNLVVKEAIKTARRLGLPLYLVGGVVRDMLMGRAIKDVDLVVVGNAVGLASALAGALSGDVVARSQFGTAKLHVQNQSIDVVTARRETYKKPGALPTVYHGAIADDLARRDFTINAIALRLHPAPMQLLDPTGGQSDLQQGLIRLLHAASFQDDATRILRAVRYEQRLGFQLEPETERLLRRDLPMLDTISGDRLRRELDLIFREEQAGPTLLRAAGLGVLAAIYPTLPDAPALKQRLTRLSAGGLSQPLHCLALLAYSMKEEDMEGFIGRLNMPATWAKVVRDVALARESAAYLATESSPAVVCRRLRELSLEAVEVAGALAESEGARRNTQRYVQEWRHIRPRLNGHDLTGLGVPSGPQLGKLLEELRDARLKGRVHTKADEEALVKERLAS